MRKAAKTRQSPGGKARDFSASQPARRLPRGVNSLPSSIVRNHQQQRILIGTALAVAEHGYAQTSVKHILEHAGVSRADFYKLFQDKESCYLYGFNQLAEAQLRQVEGAISRHSAVHEQLIAGVNAYLSVLDIEPRFTRAFFLEAEAGSPAVRAEFAQAGLRLQHLLGDWASRMTQENPQIPSAGETTLLGLRTGLLGILLDWIRQNRFPLADRTHALVDFIVRVLGASGWRGGQ